MVRARISLSTRYFYRSVLEGSHSDTSSRKPERQSRRTHRLPSSHRVCADPEAIGTGIGPLSLGGFKNGWRPGGSCRGLVFHARIRRCRRDRRRPKTTVWIYRYEKDAGFYLLSLWDYPFPAAYP